MSFSPYLSSPSRVRAVGAFYNPGTLCVTSVHNRLLALDMDPVALRLKNYAEKDPEEGRLWSSKSLRACH